MTYGFKFLNNYEETVLDDSSVKPWFLRQAGYIAVQNITEKFVGVLNQTDSEGVPFTNFSPPETDVINGNGNPKSITSWTVYKVTYRADPDYDCFILFNLPVNYSQVYYNCHNPVALAEPGGPGGIVELFVYVPNTWTATTADIPKAYLFAVNPIPNSLRTNGYGVQLFNTIAQCVYDSGKKHLEPTAYPSILVSADFVSPRTYTRRLGSFIPSTQVQQNEYIVNNAAWLLPLCRWVYVGQTSGVWYNNYWETLYKRDPYPGNGNRMISAEAATFRTQSLYTSSPGMYYGPNRSPGNPDPEELKSLVVDATPLDGGVVPPGLPQSFVLTKNKSGLTEGEDNGIIITLNTVSVPNGTIVPFTITGIEAADIAPMRGFAQTLTGYFIVVDNTATQRIDALTDAFIEGTQTATLRLDNGASSVQFTISDFVSYSLSSFMTPEEGQSIAVTLTTQGLANGSTVPYTITGITQADLSVGTISGNFTISSNTGGLEFRFARDASTENETMRISVNNGATFLSIPITDVPAGNEVLTLSPSTFQYHERTTLTITGGTPNGSFEFTNLPQGIDPVYAWNNRWKPEYSTVGTQYFDENGNFSNPPATPLGPDGSDLGANPAAVSNRTFWIFTTTTKNFRSFNYTVNPTQTFSITGSDGTKGPLTISETSTGYFKVTTTGVPTGTVVYPKFINTDLDANDYTNSAASGVAVNSSGIANFTIEFTADQRTDGTKTGELVVQYPNGITKDSYGVITVLDASLTPASYSLTKSVPIGSTADEGTAAYFYLTTNQTANLYWVLEGTGITADDIQAAGAYDADNNYYSYGAGLYGIINSNYYQLFIQFKNDVKTEGNETLTVNIKTGSQNGQVVASAVVIIGDTSVYPAAGTPSGDPFCIGVNRYQAYHNGQGGLSTAVIEYNSVICGYIPPASYSVSRYVATVNENGFQFFTIGLTSVPSGTQLWWDISGTNITTNDIQYVYHDAQDGNGWFTPSGGTTLNNTFTVYGQTSYQVIVYPRSDLQTEGTETATFNLRTGYSGGPSQASTSFDIADTSTTPSYNESLTIVSDANGNHIIPLNGYMTISITGGAPNTTFTYNSGTLNTDPQPSSFPGVATLDGSGSFYNYITGATYRGSQSIGDMRLWVRFSNGNIRSARANIVYDAATTNGPEYCSGFTRYQNYNDGVGGVYAQVVATNSPLCGYVQQYTPTRTAVTYNYYNFDFQGDTWGMDGGRPGGAVTATIVTGPYTGFALSGSFNGSGQYRQVIGNYGSLAVGFYTINFTFPGQDAYYPSNYRTIVAYFYVQNASAGDGGIIP